MTHLALGIALLVAGAAGTTPEHVFFPSPDGGVVHADLYGDGERGVVLAPGGRFRKESWAAQAAVLAGEGFRVLAIDFRGRGESRGGPDAAGDELQLDVLAAVRYLRETGATWIAVVGASLGGWAAGNAAVEAEPGEIDRLVLLAPSPVDEPERMQGAKLFLTARDDTDGSGRPRLVRIREQYEKASGPKELIVVDGEAHAQYLFDTDQGPRVLEAILVFLAGNPAKVDDATARPRD
ncbi:MAG: alpha/beta fold hydrolase [Acidobacteriota bacterium]|jgi:pimeloyl-ACP methyl ester carboxylesterase